MGAAFAVGMDDRQLVELAQRIGSRQHLLDRTLPIISFYSTRKITNLIRELSGELEIEDLWLPYFCVSCNLSKGSQMVHTRGPVWLGVRASMAAMPIFTPILHEGDLLVDGGFLNNLPVDVMRQQFGSAAVLGIDCSPLSPKTRQYDFGPSISAWEALRYQMQPPEQRKGPPNMLSGLTQIMDTNGIYRQQFTKDSRRPDCAPAGTWLGHAGFRSHRRYHRSILPGRLRAAGRLATGVQPGDTPMIPNASPSASPTCLRVGHGGAAGHARPNSLRSLHLALEMGVDMVEFDVRPCRDGLVLLHDDSLAAFGHAGLASQTRLDELRALPGVPDGPVATLEQALDLLQGQVRINVDVKDAGYEASVVEAVAARGLLGRGAVQLDHPCQPAAHPAGGARGAGRDFVSRRQGQRQPQALPETGGVAGAGRDAPGAALPGGRYDGGCRGECGHALPPGSLAGCGGRGASGQWPGLHLDGG